MEPYYKSKKFDCHVHIGQFYDSYWQPHTIIETLKKNGVHGCYFSSTTSCLKWSSDEEKQYILKHIEDEVDEALFIAKKINFDGKALYWPIIEHHKDGFTIEEVMKSKKYSGFKIHTLQSGWDDVNDKYIYTLFDEICHYADLKKMPILIHCGVNECSYPSRFDEWFGKYKDIKFILAHMRPVDIVINEMAKHENVWADTALAEEGDIKKVFDAGFADRVLYGTDYPFNKNVYN